MSEILTVKEAADYLRLSPDTIRRYCESKLIPAVRIGNRWRIHRHRLIEFFGVQEKLQTNPTLKLERRA